MRWIAAALAVLFIFGLFTGAITEDTTEAELVTLFDDLVEGLDDLFYTIANIGRGTVALAQHAIQGVTEFVGTVTTWVSDAWNWVTGWFTGGGHDGGGGGPR